MENIKYLLPVALLIIVVLLVVLWRYKKELESKTLILEEKEEKIKYLRQISAENEHRHNAKVHEDEKTILALQHSIETLETKAKEGTKNQVVSMIVAQQAKRAKLLERAGISL